MKHRPHILGVLGTLLLLAIAGAGAADTWKTEISGTMHWDSAVWEKNGVPVTDGSFPGSPGDILFLSSIGNSNTLYLERHRTIGTLNSTGGSVRIRSGRSGTNAHNTLELQTVNITGGTLSFFDRNPDTSEISVIADVLNVTGGNLALGEYGLSATRAAQNFNITGTTTISSGRILGVTHSGYSTMHLGVVNNAGILDLAWKGGGTGSTSFGEGSAHTVSVESLSGDGRVTTSVAAENAAPRATLEIKGSNTANFTGLIEDGVETGSIALRKTGSGTQYLRRAQGNTYSGGTVVENGILAVENTSGSGLGTGAILVKEGGTLAARYRTRIELGEGSAIHVEGGGKLRAGIDGTPGIAVLTLSGASNGSAPMLVMDEGAGFEYRLGVGTSDRIEFLDYKPGDLILNGNQVHFTLTPEAVGPGSWELFRFDADISGEDWWSNNGLVLGGGLGVWEEHASFIYTQNGIYLQIIPEPQSIVLCLTALGGLLLFRKKARSTPAHL